MSDDSLVPPDDLLFDGTTSREEFIQGGPGFLWNCLVARAWLQPHHAVLDMGSGNGKHARLLAQYLKPPEGRYVGFDIVRKGIEWCQRAYAPYPNFRFDFVDLRSDWYNPGARAVAEDHVFPYADASFDVAFAASLFTHLEPHAARNYIRNAERVLKPGGRLLLTCFMVNEHNGGRHAVDVQGRRFMRASSVHHVVDHRKPSRGVAYDENALRAMICDAGLVAAELTFGTWSNGVDVLAALQDSIVAVKRPVTA
jgi:SAM-dependent methyltransferase